MKKTLCIVLITAMLLSIIPMVVFADTTPVEITTADELKNMEDNGNYVLANDIYISGTWQNKETVTGITLDGNGKTIYYNDGTTIYGGLFRQVNGITIKNLNVKQLGNTTYIGNNATSDEGGEVSSLIRRTVGGTITVTNVSIYANIMVTEANGAALAGGFVAKADGGSINLTRCIFDGTITKNYSEGGGQGVAGMIGGCYGSSSYTMTECINYGAISSGNHVGGFFGAYAGGNWDGNDSRTFKITQCINYGDITLTRTTGGDQSAGGFIGYYNTNPGSTNDFRYNINYGNVTATGENTQAAGFAGYFRMPSTSTYKIYGFVNYGNLSAVRGVTNVIAYLNLKGNNTRDTQQNYGHSDTYNVGNAGSNSTLITTTGEGLCTTLNNYFSAKPYTTLPNGKVTLTWAKEFGYADKLPGQTDAVLIGVQLGGSAEDENRNIRFVGGISNVSSMDQVGMLIIATYANGESRKVFEGQTETVYESIISDGNQIYATDYGKRYFYTVVVNDIPTELGEVNFTVRAFETKNGEVAYSDSHNFAASLLPDEYIRDGWTLAAPAYEGGTLATTRYDAGTGLDQDNGSANLERAYMMCISNTSKTEFTAYTNKLVSCGYVLDSQNEMRGADNVTKLGSIELRRTETTNLYRQYRKGDNLLYVTYNEVRNEARIIQDRISTPESQFEYTFSHNTSTAAEIYMYGMKYHSQGLNYSDEGGDPNTTNNGSFFIIKQADNSVILIDGGAQKQATAAAVEGLWSFLHQITGKTADEEITIACWFITHPHEDHYNLPYALIQQYHSQLDLQRVMFNFPNPTEVGINIYDFRGGIENYYPDVMYAKCHTGQSIQLGSVVLDVLTTHEDMVSATTGETLMTEGNSMSTVIRFTMPDGTTFLNLGDYTSEQQTNLITDNTGMLHTSELICDIVEVAHHGYNMITDTYKATNAKYALWTNYKPDAFTGWKKDTADAIVNRLTTYTHVTEQTIYYAGINTVKLNCVNGNITVTLTNLVY